MVDVRRLVDGMVRAVAIEQDVVRQGKPSRDDARRADGVHLMNSSGDGARYGFRMPQWPPSWQAMSVLVQAGDGQPWHHAEVISVSATGDTACEVVIETGTTLPAGTRTVQVRKDDAALLRALTTRLEDLASSPAELVRLASAVVSPATRTRTGHDHRTAARVLTGLRPSPTRHVVGLAWAGRLRSEQTVTRWCLRDGPSQGRPLRAAATRYQQGVARSRGCVSQAESW